MVMMAASMRCDRDAAPLIAIVLPFTVCICVANLQLQLQLQLQQQLGGIISRRLPLPRSQREAMRQSVAHTASPMQQINQSDDA